MPRKRKENKRANNTGSLTERTFTRPDGRTYTRWQAEVTVGYTDEGKPRRKTVYGNSQAEAIAKMQEVRQQLNSGTYADTDKTVKAYLADWLKEKARTVRPGTLEQYEYAVKHLSERIGRVQLAKLTPLQAQNVLSEITDAHGPSAGSKARTVLFMALKQAVKWQLVPRNVAEATEPLKKTPKEIKTWTVEEAAHFLDTIQGHRLYALFYLDMATGMRRGELLGLRWQDVTVGNDCFPRNAVHARGMQEGALTIRQTLVKVKGKTVVSTPKTAKGYRRVTIGPDVQAVLEDHRKCQMLEREFLGEAWPDTGLVFTSEVGTPYSPDNIKRLRCQLMDKAGVPRVRLHDLRHLHVSLLVKRGLDAKTIADRVGHSRASFTMDVYAHLFEEQRQAATVSLTELLGSSVPPESLN